MLFDLIYQLADYVPYSAATWLALLETVNQNYWPWSLLLVPAMCLLLTSARFNQSTLDASGLAILAICWAWSGWIFLGQYFAPLHWITSKIIPFFLLQVVLVLFYAFQCLRKRLVISQTGSGKNVLLLGAALVLLPILQLISGSNMAQLSWPALVPDATALVSVAWLSIKGRGRTSLIYVPLAWLLIASLHGLALGLQAETLLLPIALAILLTRSRLGS